MAGPCGVLPMGPVVATNEVVEDVDGEPPEGCYRWIRQRPQLLPQGIDGRPPGGCCR
jgi:hypothetical protein